MKAWRTLRAQIAGWLIPEFRAGLERSFLENPAEWLVMMFGGGASASGVTVTPANALGTAFGVAVRNLSEDLGSLPLITYERMKDGSKRRDSEFHLYPILHDEPNPEMDSMQFVETMTAHALMRPGAYAEVVRNGAGEITALWPLHPDRVRVLRMNGEVTYHITLPAGERTAEGTNYKLFSRQKVLHLRGLSLDGMEGLARLETHREGIGLTLAIDEHGARFYRNGATFGTTIEVPGRLGDTAYQRMLAAFDARHRGLENAHRTALLEEGAKLAKSAGIEPRASQYIETRRFQVIENARAARMPPHLIGDMSEAKWANIEQQGIDYVVHTIRPHAIRWERAIHRQLFTPAERETHFVEFLLDALVRGDRVSRYAGHAQGRQWGWLSVNDIRRLENMDPLGPEGDVYLQPVNMLPAGESGTPPPQATPPPRPKEEPTDDEGDDEEARAFLPLFRDHYGRALRREAKALVQAAKKGDLKSFEETFERFLMGEEADLRSALQPLFETFLAVAGAKPDEAARRAAQAAERHRRLIRAKVAGAVIPPATLEQAVQGLAACWQKDDEAARLALAELEHQAGRAAA